MSLLSMGEVLRSHGDFACGGDRMEDLVEAWVTYDISPDQADAWLTAGVFIASSAYELVTEGITPEQVDEASPENEGLGHYPSTLGYKYANGDLTLPQLIEAIKIRKEVA